MAVIKMINWLIWSEDGLGAGRRERMEKESVLLTTQGKVELMIKTI